MTPILRCAFLVSGLLFALPLCAQTISFPASELGKSAAGFETLLTGGGPPPLWQVVADGSAASGHALAQLSANTTDNRFPLAVFQATKARNLVATARFKTVSGKVDQAGGLAIRLTDANNYYIVRANALEDNVSFYRVVNGNRQELASAKTKVAPGVWHAIGLRAQANKFTILFNGAELYSFNDSTFPDAGRVALWTKADSVTYFDQLKVEVLP